jgi:hypothetical protein
VVTGTFSEGRRVITIRNREAVTGEILKRYGVQWPAPKCWGCRWLLSETPDDITSGMQSWIEMVADSPFC